MKICKVDSIQDADANVYNTLAIGSQCWLDRNMNVGTRISGATTQTNNGTIEKYCYSNLNANCTTNHPNKPDGGLYQWNEAMQYSTTEGARGICPAGFHIPTDAEWQTLEKFLKDSRQSCDPNTIGLRCAPVGTKLKSGNSIGFEGNLAGYGSGFSVRDAYGIFWSSSETGATSAWDRYLQNSEERVVRAMESKSLAISVHCIQD